MLSVLPPRRTPAASGSICPDRSTRTCLAARTRSPPRSCASASGWATGGPSAPAVTGASVLPRSTRSASASPAPRAARVSRRDPGTKNAHGMARQGEAWQRSPAAVRPPSSYFASDWHYGRATDRSTRASSEGCLEQDRLEVPICWTFERHLREDMADHSCHRHQTHQRSSDRETA